MSAGQAFADDATDLAFGNDYMLRLGAYFVNSANTELSVNSSTGGLGTSIDYQRDLGGEGNKTIPRLDAYYRFNDRHRIDFSTFKIDRAGSATLALDVNIGDQNYEIPSDLDISQFQSVVIWCVPFRVPFNAATLAVP